MHIERSLVIPAYNEAVRLPPYLESIRLYFDRRYPARYEVIVVDDGSHDGLANLLAEISEGWPELRVIEHPRNLGKGAAVRTGMTAAEGETLLFADADGATPIGAESKLAEAIAEGADVAVGSRLVSAEGVSRQRTWIRGAAGRLFALIARRCLHIGVRDTQCGFKMFRRDAARQLFARSRESGYLFDLELLGWADRLEMRVAEVPIDWADVPGGHLSLVREVTRIFPGLIRLRRRLAAD